MYTRQGGSQPFIATTRHASLGHAAGVSSADVHCQHAVLYAGLARNGLQAMAWSRRVRCCCACSSVLGTTLIKRKNEGTNTNSASTHAWDPNSSPSS